MSSEDVASGCSGSVRNVRWSGGAWLRLRHRKWSAAELTGVMLFIASILLLVIGLLLTVLGFGKRTGDDTRMDEGGEEGGTKHHQHHQLLLRVAGPSCLSMTTVIWVAGYVFVRLWKAEQRQHNVSMHELSDRLHMHAVARDLLKKASHHHHSAATTAASSMILRSPTIIKYDAQLRRLLSRQLQRHHKSTTAADHRSAEVGSRRGSHCSMIVSSSKCRPTSLLSSSCTFKTPHISVDAGNREARSLSTPGGSHRSSSRVVNGSSSFDSTLEDLEHFIIFHSKVSTCSSLSLAGSRSSRTSSSFGSFLWDLQTPVAETTDPRNSSVSCRRRGSRDLNETKEDSVASTTQAKRGSASMLEVSYHPLFHGTTRRNSSSSCNGSKRAPPGAGDRRPSWTAGIILPPSASHIAPAAFRRPPSASSAVHRRQDNTYLSTTNTTTTTPS